MQVGVTTYLFLLYFCRSMSKKLISRLLINISGLCMIVLSFVSYRTMCFGFGMEGRTPEWLLCAFLAIWFAIASDRARESKVACFVVPISFYLFMAALSVIKLFVYRDDLGDTVCVDTIVGIAQWNSIALLCVPLLLYAHKLDKVGQH